MSTLTLVAANPKNLPVSIALAHDVRNALATLAIHLATLERLSGPQGAKASSAAQALLDRTACICAEAMREQDRPDLNSRHSGFDIVRLMRQIAKLVAPIVPAGVAIDVQAEGPITVVGSQTDIFRILFNLVHNALQLALAGSLTRIELAAERHDGRVAIRVSDNGPGLPKAIADYVVQNTRSSAKGPKGFGLAIARELAERNCATLGLVTGPSGAAFTLVMAPFLLSARERDNAQRLGERM